MGRPTNDGGRLVGLENERRTVGMTITEYHNTQALTPTSCLPLSPHLIHSTLLIALLIFNLLLRALLV